jgi:alkylation response protein AidB-like acyl-CoA dehydrogenase
LSDEEQSFLDNETQALCDMVHEWDIEQMHDLPESVWTYIKEKGFLGLVIPKEYGGKGFSARAHSDVVMKVSSRSGVAAVTVMVPNSLGPGELLVHYGTEEQKEYYLPRLAQGIDIPCSVKSLTTFKLFAGALREKTILLLFFVVKNYPDLPK